MICHKEFRICDHMNFLMTQSCNAEDFFDACLVIFSAQHFFMRKELLCTIQKNYFSWDEVRIAIMRKSKTGIIDTRKVWPQTNLEVSPLMNLKEIAVYGKDALLLHLIA